MTRTVTRGGQIRSDVHERHDIADRDRVARELEAHPAGDPDRQEVRRPVPSPLVAIRN